MGPREVRGRPCIHCRFSWGGSAEAVTEQAGSHRGWPGFESPGAGQEPQLEMGSAPAAVCPWAECGSSLASLSSLPAQLGAGGL